MRQSGDSVKADRYGVGMGVLLIASTGGHLAQLHRLARRIPEANHSRTWVTFDTPQSRSLLAGEHVEFVRYTGPRDWRSIARNSDTALRLLSSGQFHQVVSTGAGIALSFLPTARALGVPCTYIESAARSDGPSMTGRLLQKVPGVDLATQYRRWSDDRWRHAGSVFDELCGAKHLSSRPVRRVLVTLGTIRYPFTRLIERTRSMLPADVELVIQAGSTSVVDGKGDAVREMPSAVFMEELRRADAVIAHAGTGSAISALEAGKCPILVPRERASGEHVDDHQQQIAAELNDRDLALGVPVDELSWETVEQAAQRSVERRPQPPRISLGAPDQTPPSRRRLAAAGRARRIARTALPLKLAA